MAEGKRTKQYDLEDRTFEFAGRVRALAKRLPSSVTNAEDIKQLARSSGSVGANYIEANESLGKKDFQMHIKISRKEAKESAYWLGLLDCGADAAADQERERLRQEARELTNIFGAILQKTS